jgi:hypothetical protein
MKETRRAFGYAVSMAIVRRLLLSLVLIPVSLYFGFMLSMFVVGGPHAMPGLLADAPDSVREPVGLVVTCAPVPLVLWLIWRKPRSGEPRSNAP